LAPDQPKFLFLLANSKPCDCPQDNLSTPKKHKDLRTSEKKSKAKKFQ